MAALMTPAERLQITLQLATAHAEHCRRCQLPSLDRPMTTDCGDGRRHDLAVIRAWRDRVIALTDRSRG